MNISDELSYTFTFEFEKHYDKHFKRQWMAENWHHSLTCSIIYIIVVFGLRNVMSKRPCLKLRGVLITWNLVLAVFSIACLIRMWPEFMHSINNYGFTYSVCNPSYIDDKVSGLWAWLFALSKVPELGDTLFIVLRKTDLIFLHWYHHISVLVFTWYCYWQHIAPARWYIFMNLLAHSCMYTYYFFRAMGVKINSFVAMAITISQILQMVGGFSVSLWSVIVLYQGGYCEMNYLTACFAIGMYISYFILFGKYFLKRYTFPPINYFFKNAVKLD